MTKNQKKKKRLQNESRIEKSWKTFKGTIRDKIDLLEMTKQTANQAFVQKGQTKLSKKNKACYNRTAQYSWHYVNKRVKKISKAFSPQLYG